MNDNIWILDKGYQVLGVMSNQGNMDKYYDQEMTETLDNGIVKTTLLIRTNSNQLTNRHLKEGNRLVMTDEDNQLRMFIIVQGVDEHSFESVNEIFATEIGIELTNEQVQPIKYTNKKVKDIFADMIRTTDFEVGKCEFSSYQTIEFTEHESIMERLHKMVEEIDCEIYFTTKMKGSVVDKKYMNIVSQVGKDNGDRFIYERDILSIKRTVDIFDLVNTLYGVGNVDSKNIEFNIKNYAFKKSEGYPMDKPLGVAYIQDKESVKRFGKISQTFKAETNDPKEMSQLIYNELITKSMPKISYEMDTTDLSNSARIGDNYYVIDYKFEPPLYLEARIVNKVTSKTNPENNKVTIGDYEIEKDLVKVEVKEIKEKIRKGEIGSGNGSDGSDGSTEETPEGVYGQIGDDGVYSFNDSEITKGDNLLRYVYNYRQYENNEKSSSSNGSHMYWSSDGLDGKRGIKFKEKITVINPVDNRPITRTASNTPKFYLFNKSDYKIPINLSKAYLFKFKVKIIDGSGEQALSYLKVKYNYKKKDGTISSNDMNAPIYGYINQKKTFNTKSEANTDGEIEYSFVISGMNTFVDKNHDFAFGNAPQYSNTTGYDLCWDGENKLYGGRMINDWDGVNAEIDSIDLIQQDKLVGNEFFEFKGDRPTTIAYDFQMYQIGSSDPVERATTDKNENLVFKIGGNEARFVSNINESEYKSVRAKDFIVGSSIKYKDNLVKLEDVMNPLEMVKSIQPWQYHLKSNLNEMIFDKPKLGVLNEMVPQQLRDEDGVDPYAVSALLLGAVRQLSNDVDALKKENQDLKELISEMIKK